LQRDGERIAGPIHEETPMKRPRAATLAALFALAISPILAQPGSPDGPPPEPGPRHLAVALHEVDLSYEQEARIEALMTARHDGAASNRQAADAARRALGDQVRSDTFDEAAIRAKAAALAPFAADRAVAEALLLRDVRRVLTADQRKTFDRVLVERP
jgi:Spy/CpxP family protein refolding chaperone